MDKKNTAIFSLVIVLAAVVIVAGILFSRLQPETYNQEEQEEPVQYSIEPVTNEDHIIGNPNADVILIEYSDLTCAHCREFHPTMKRLIQEYGKTGNFAWVYRHFPSVDAVTGEKTISKTASIAAECINEQVGPTAFWDFIDGVLTKLPAGFSENDLRNFAIELGAEEESYDTCLVGGRFEEKIQRNIDDGLEIYKYDPNFGTPYNIIITKTGTQMEIIGAQPYDLIEQIIMQHAFPDSL